MALWADLVKHERLFKRRTYAVEQGEVDDHPAEQSAFTDAEEESNGEETGVGCDEAGAHGHYSPCCDQCWQVVAWFKVFQDQVGWHIDEDIWDVEDGESDVELITGKV